MFTFIKLSTCHAQLPVVCHLFGTIAFMMTLGEAVVLVDPVEHWLSDGEEQRIVFFSTVMSYSAMMSMNNPDFMEPIIAQV